MIQRARVRIAHALTHRRPKRARAIVLAAVIAAGCAGRGGPGERAAAHPDGAAQPTVIDQTGGVSMRLGLVAQGDRAYYTVGPRLVVADLSDPSQPREVGRSAPAEGVLYALAVRGTTAFAGGYERVWRFDVSGPAAPRLLGVHQIRGHFRTVVGHRLYSMSSMNEIIAYDLPDDGAPVELGTVQGTHDVGDFAAGPDNFLWIMHGANGVGYLTGIDATHPAGARVVGEELFSANEGPKSVVVDGTTAYVVMLDGVLAVDVSDRTAPRRIARTSQRHYIEAIAVAGGRLVTGYWQGSGTTMTLEWFDVSQPDTLPSLGTLSMPGEVSAVVAALSGDRAVLITGLGLRIVDLAPPGGLRPAGLLEWQKAASDLHIASDHLVSFDAINGLWTYGMAETGAIIPAGHVTLPGIVKDMAVAGPTAFLSVGDGKGVHAVALDDPTAPRVIGIVPGYFYRLAILGSTLFATAYSSAAPDAEVLRAIDVADPTHPRLIQGAPLPVPMSIPGRVRRMTAAGRWVFVATDSTGLWIVDVSDPAAPEVAGRFPDMGWNGDVAVDGNFAYLVDGTGLRILDVSDPAAIRPVGQLLLSGGATSIELAGDIAYLAAWMSPETEARIHGGNLNDLVAVDIRNPARPVEVARATTLPSVSRARPSADGRWLYVATTEGGVYSVEWRVAATPGEAGGAQLFLPFGLRHGLSGTAVTRVWTMAPTRTASPTVPGQ